MKNDKIWNRYKLREEINRLLDLIDARDAEAESDMAGGGCPAMISILFMLEKISDETFFGTVEITSKGPKTIKPSVTKQTFKADVLYGGYLS